MKKVLYFLFLIMFLLSPLISQTWSALKRLTWTADDSSYPAIATDPGKGIHVVWYDKTPGNSEVFYKRSTDSGSTWLAPARLTWNAGRSIYPEIAADSGTGIHVAWSDDTPMDAEIFYKRSTDSGSTWSTPTRLTWKPGFDSHIAITTSSGNKVHVVWAHDGLSANFDIYYKRSTDGGSSWLAPIRLTWNSGYSFYPSIAAEPSFYLYVVWQDDTSGNDEIYFKPSTNGGTSWSSATRLTWNSGLSKDPRVAVDSSSRVHVVWIDNTTGNTEVYYKRSNNFGGTWSAPTRLTWTSANTYVPTIAADSGNGIHIVYRDDSPGEAEIFYKSSPNYGLTWSGNTRLTWNSGGSIFPIIAVDPADNIHVVWEDLTPGNREIFYKNRK